MTGMTILIYRFETQNFAFYGYGAKLWHGWLVRHAGLGSTPRHHYPEIASQRWLARQAGLARLIGFGGGTGNGIFQRVHKMRDHGIGMKRARGQT